MESSKQQLIATLRETIGVLDAVDEHHWALRLRGDLERLEKDDGGAIDHLLSAYGGAGSLADLYLCSENGHRVSPDAVSEINSRLQRLTGLLWETARKLKQ